MTSSAEQQALRDRFLPTLGTLPAFECDTGWLTLIGHTLAALEARLTLTGAPPVRLVQLKEKFGLLRIYLQIDARRLVESVEDDLDAGGQGQRLAAYHDRVLKRQIESGDFADEDDFDLPQERDQPARVMAFALAPDLRPRRWLISELESHTGAVRHWVRDTLRLPAPRWAQVLAEQAGSEDQEEDATVSRTWTITEYLLPDPAVQELQAERRELHWQPRDCWVERSPRWLDPGLQKIIQRAGELSGTVCEVCGDAGVLRKRAYWYQTRCARHADGGVPVPE